MIVLATGSRDWNNKRIIEDVLKGLKASHSGLLVVQGGARGADKIVRETCTELGIECKTVDAEWVRYGKAAGVIRNQRMLDEYKPDLVIAFLFTFSQNKGTRDMINRAEQAHVRVEKYHD